MFSSNSWSVEPGLKTPGTGNGAKFRRLVIFLRATVIQDPSIDGDFQSFRGQLPTEDFFLKPNPSKLEPPLGPSGRPIR